MFLNRAPVNPLMLMNSSACSSAVVGWWVRQLLYKHLIDYVLVCVHAGSYAKLSDPAVSGHSQGTSEASPGKSHHSRMAQVTPVGLRLYDAQGSCSIVPLEELRQMMQKLSFSRSAVVYCDRHSMTHSQNK